MGDILYYSIGTCASISLGTCGVLLVAIMMLKGLNILPYKLIPYLCITDMITSIGDL